MIGAGRNGARKSADKIHAVRPSTLVEITGKNRVIIEHHKGIRHYGNDHILLGTSYGLLEINGSGLLLRCMGKEQMCIVGCIETVMLLGRDTDGSMG